MNHLKHDRETGFELLRSYMYHVINKQHEYFNAEEDPEVAAMSDWTEELESLQKAKDMFDVITVVVNFAEGDPVESAELMMEALVSYREEEYRKVELQFVKAPPLVR